MSLFVLISKVWVPKGEKVKMKWGEGVLALQISHEPLELEGLGPLLPADDRSSVFGGQGPCCPPWPPQAAPETPAQQPASWLLDGPVQLHPVSSGETSSRDFLLSRLH